MPCVAELAQLRFYEPIFSNGLRSIMDDDSTNSFIIFCICAVLTSTVRNGSEMYCIMGCVIAE